MIDIHIFSHTSLSSKVLKFTAMLSLPLDRQARSIHLSPDNLIDLLTSDINRNDNIPDNIREPCSAILTDRTSDHRAAVRTVCPMLFYRWIQLRVVIRQIMRDLMELFERFQNRFIRFRSIRLITDRRRRWSFPRPRNITTHHFAPFGIYGSTASSACL